MAELPESWGLKAQPRTDGKLDIIGKTDDGHDYRVRTTDGPEITNTDITELRAADREAYDCPRSEAAWRAVHNLVDDGKRRKQERDDAFGESLMDPAAEVSFALTDRKGHSSPFTGSTRAFRRGWEIAFGKEN